MGRAKDAMPNFGRQQRERGPLVIGTCKLAGDPIRTGEDTVWLRRPMGLSHRACLAAAVKAGQEVEA